MSTVMKISTSGTHIWITTAIEFKTTIVHKLRRFRTTNVKRGSTAQAMGGAD